MQIFEEMKSRMDFSFAGNQTPLCEDVQGQMRWFLLTKKKIKNKINMFIDKTVYFIQGGTSYAGKKTDYERNDFGCSFKTSGTKRI